MSRTCLTCSAHNRLDAERMFIAGKSISEISRTCGIPYESLRCHMADHLSRQLVQSTRKTQALQAMDMLQSIEDLIARTKHILDLAEKKGQYGMALSAIGEARQGYQLLCQIAVAMHSARQQELEAEREYNHSQEHDDFGERLQVLTMPELLMLKRIQAKLESQNKKDIIIPETPDLRQNTVFQFNIGDNISLQDKTAMRRTKPPVKESLEQSTETIEQYNTRIEASEPGKHSYINGRIVPNGKEPARTSMDDPEVLKSIHRLNYGR